MKTLAPSYQDTKYAAKVSANSPKQITAVDFGTGAALAIHGPGGPVPKRDLQLPRVPGGKTPRDEFRLILKALLEYGNVVVESPTIGSSGAEPADVEEALANSPNSLYTISARAVKNYRMDHKLENPKSYPKYMTESDSTQPEAHVLDAEILYKIATEESWRLRKWRLGNPIERAHSSVRPMDKRGYRDERSLGLLESLPPFGSLPKELQESPIGLNGEYRATLAVPFALALTEPYLDEGPEEKRRQRFQKIIGANEHGYPSFYRRMYITWMQENAKKLANVSRIAEVPRNVRRDAFKLTQKQVRWLYHLAS